MQQRSRTHSSGRSVQYCDYRCGAYGSAALAVECTGYAIMYAEQGASRSWLIRDHVSGQRDARLFLASVNLL